MNPREILKSNLSPDTMPLFALDNGKNGDENNSETGIPILGIITVAVLFIALASFVAYIIVENS